MSELCYDIGIMSRVFSMFLPQALRAKANKDANPQGALATCCLALPMSLVDMTMVVNPVRKALAVAVVAVGAQRRATLHLIKYIGSAKKLKVLRERK